MTDSMDAGKATNPKQFLEAMGQIEELEVCDENRTLKPPGTNNLSERPSKGIKELSMLEKEIPLSGGNITGVVRIGQTVRRPIGPWSASVHGLLQYLETQGFEGAPRFLGVDQQER